MIVSITNYRFYEIGRVRTLNKVSNNYAASFIHDDVAKWNDHKEDGKYIVGFTISASLDALNQKLIPQVRQQIML